MARGETKFGAGARGGITIPQYLTVPFTARLNADCVDTCFFIARRAMQVVAADWAHSAAGNDAGAVNAQLTKDTGTDAPGAGANLLTNNSNAGFNCKGAADTVQNGTLTTTEADLKLAAGDRLSWDFAGTVTNLAGVVATVTLKYI